MSAEAAMDWWERQAVYREAVEDELDDLDTVDYDHWVWEAAAKGRKAWEPGDPLYAQREGHMGTQALFNVREDVLPWAVELDPGYDAASWPTKEHSRHALPEEPVVTVEGGYVPRVHNVTEQLRGQA